LASIGKTIAIKLHLWLGLASGLVICIVALSGALLVFEEELEPLLYPQFHTVSTPGGQRLPLDRIVAAATAEYPGKKLIRLEVEPHENRTVIVGLQHGSKPKEVLSVAVDPYSGKAVASRWEQASFFSVVLRLHRYLCLGDTGKWITGISCSMFLVIMLTGMVLWWPSRQNRKQRFRIKWNASAKRLNWDLHAVLGFYAWPLVFLIALTGLVWSYKWVNNLIFYALDGKPPTKREAPANLTLPDARQQDLLEAMYTQTNRELPYPGRVMFSFPASDSLSVTVSKENDEAAIRNVVSMLYFDWNTGQLIGKRLYKHETRGFKARRLVFPIHTGSLLGWPTKVLALFAALLAASLPITGFYIWWGKHKKKTGRKRKESRRVPLTQ